METLNIQIIRFQNDKRLYRYVIHRSEKSFIGTVVNQTLPSLHGGLLEIMPTVSFKMKTGHVNLMINLHKA